MSIVRIQRIKYTNYRPFVDSEIEFPETDGITLLVGTNGSGKSEILLSVLWCFYGESLFKFKDLRGKKNTPYSLHNRTYNNVKQNKQFKAEAIVEIDFENKGRYFTLERKEIFNARNIRNTSTELRLSEKINGVTTTPIKNETRIKLVIQEHLPAHIAKALFFDGEKMEKLTDDDKKEDEVITIIKEVTDLSTLESLKDRLKALKTESTKQMTKSSRSENVDRLIRDKERQESREVTVRLDLEREEDFFEDAKNQINKILSKIDKIKENSKKKDKLKDYEKNLKVLEVRKENKQKQLSDEISANGYLFFLDEIFNDVTRFVENVNIPIGINSKSLELIIRGDFNNKCVCGRDLNSEVLEFLTDLKKKLPPEFKPAEITNQMHFISNDKRSTYNKIIGFAKDVRGYDKSIREVKENIKVLENEVFEITKDDRSVQDEFARFIKQRDDAKKAIDKLKPELRHLSHTISQLKRDIKELQGMSESFEKARKQTELYEEYIKFINQLLAVENHNSLIELNKFFKDAFNNISADLDEQFEVEIDAKFAINKYVNENGKKELQSSSSGQLKVIAMAFIKAITDFATKVAADDIFKEKRTFPVLIDAAFGDISEGNLEGVSTQLNFFNTQLIVLVAKTQLDTFKSQIEGNVNKQFTIVRNQGKRFSTIEEDKL